MTKTSDARYSPNEPAFQMWVGQQMGDCLLRLNRNILSSWGQGIHFLPKLRQYVQATECDLP